MNLSELIYNVIGCVHVNIIGLSLEKVLNAALEAGITLKNVKRKKYTVIEASVPSYHIKRLLKLSEEKKFEVEVISKKGVVYAARRRKKRVFLVAFLMLFVIAVLYLSGFIWEIDINGLETVRSDTIWEQVNAMGIKKGTKKADIDLDKLENQLIIQNDEIAYAGAEFEGVKLVITLKENIMPPDLREKAVSNIISTKDALRDEIKVYSGRAEVEVGQTVKKGDTLISGLIVEENKPVLKFASNAVVMGRVFYVGSAKVPLKEEKRVPTGNVVKQKFLTLGNLVSKVEFDNSFENYDITYENIAVLGENTALPVKIMMATFTEVEVQSIIKDMEEVEGEASEDAYMEAAKQVPADAEYIKSNFYFEIKDDYLICECYIETRENLVEYKYLE